jgi:hypothetical protein
MVYPSLDEWHMLPIKEYTRIGELSCNSRSRLNNNYGYWSVIMGKIAPGGVLRVRNMPTVRVEDSEMGPAANYVIVAMARIQTLLRGLARQLEDRTKLVDEYSIVSEYTAANESVVEVLPIFDRIPEKIESIIITGPVTTAFSRQLGDRFWTMSTDATGKCIIAPVAILLSINDRRILTGQAAGNWNLELMGIADERY